MYIIAPGKGKEFLLPRLAPTPPEIRIDPIRVRSARKRTITVSNLNTSPPPTFPKTLAYQRPGIPALYSIQICHD